MGIECYAELEGYDPCPRCMGRDPNCERCKGTGRVTYKVKLSSKELLKFLKIASTADVSKANVDEEMKLNLYSRVVNDYN